MADDNTDLEGLRLIAWSLEGGNVKMADECRRAADEIERLRKQEQDLQMIERVRDEPAIALQVRDSALRVIGLLNRRNENLKAEIKQLRAKLTQADQRLDRALEQMDIARDNAAWWRNLYNRLLARSVTADD